MTRLEELLIKFQDGSASPDELKELESLLGTREGRAALVDDFFMTAAICDHLRAAPAKRAARTRRSSTRAPAPTWIGVAAAILVAAFVLLLSSSREEAVPKPSVKAPLPPVPVAKAPRVEPEPIAPPPAPKEAPRPVEPLPKPAPVPELPKSDPVPAPREEPKPVPPPPPPAVPIPPATIPAPEPPKSPRSAVVGIARIEKVEGTASILTKDGKTRATVGSEFGVGQGLETGVSSRIVLAFPDKTQIDIGADSALTDAKTEGGTRLTLGSGTFKAEVAPQPKTKPLVFVTPHAEAKVLGTALRLVVDRDPKKGTLLEVEKGRVEFKRLSDRKVVIVGAGQFAVAATGSELKVKPLPPIPLATFTFEDGKTPVDWTGMVEAGPAREGNRGCLKGTYMPQEKLTRVMLSNDEGLFTHRDGAVLTFDYYADGETSILSIYCWDRTQQLSIGSYENRSLTRRQWTRAVLPLSELHERDKVLQDGDLIKNLTIQTNTGNCILFVDNVEIAVPRGK